MEAANIAIGREALHDNINGGSNIAIGYMALYTKHSEKW